MIHDDPIHIDHQHRNRHYHSPAPALLHGTVLLLAGPLARRYCESIPYCDHVGGFAGIVRTFHVDRIFDSGQKYGGRAFQDGMREAAIRRVPIHIARCGDEWTTADGVNISILSPCGALISDGKNDVNENSVVAKLRYGAFRILFMGDAGF